MAFHPHTQARDMGVLLVSVQLIIAGIAKLIKMRNIPSNSHPHIRDNILDMLNTLGKWLQKGATLSVSLLRQLQARICEVLQSNCSPLIRNVLDQPSYLPKFDNLGGEILALHCVCALFMCVFELADRKYSYCSKQTYGATLSGYHAKFI